MRAYGALDLDGETQQDLDRVVDGISKMILRLLASAVDDGSPICSVCIAQGQEEDLDYLPVVFAGRESDRAELHVEDWTDNWDPYAFRDGADVVHPSYGDEEESKERYQQVDDDLLAVWRRVCSAVEPRVLDSAQWVLSHVAYRLNRQPLPIPTTGDAAVWLFEEEFHQGTLLEQFEFVLRPDTLDALRAKAIIGRDEEAELS